MEFVVSTGKCRCPVGHILKNGKCVLCTSINGNGIVNSETECDCINTHFWNKLTL